MDKRVLVLGSGHIGSTIGAMLADAGGYRVTLADKDQDAAARAAEGLDCVKSVRLDATDASGLEVWMRDADMDAVVSCLPWFANSPVAAAAKRARVHYFDLTEDVGSLGEVRRQAEDADTAFVPMCGLAPGFIAIVAADAARRFDEVDSIRLRVGALPANPDNALKYALTWSTDGLINEYANPCTAIVDGALASLQPLEGLETLVLAGVTYEAFNTSGGLGTLAESWAGKVRLMDYKTLRHPGHCAIMKLLMQDLGLAQDRDTLKRILENALPTIQDDRVILYVGVQGRRDGRLASTQTLRVIEPRTLAGRWRTAIQVSTAAGACAVLDRVLAEPDAHHGLVRQETFPLAPILENRFGAVFA